MTLDELLAEDRAMLRRWDNPTPMPCQSASMSAFASWHVIGCHRDAAWVVLAGDGETVLRFLCDGCRQHEGWPVPAIANIHAQFYENAEAGLRARIWPDADGSWRVQQMDGRGVVLAEFDRPTEAAAVHAAKRWIEE